MNRWRNKIVELFEDGKGNCLVADSSHLHEKRYISGIEMNRPTKILLFIPLLFLSACNKQVSPLSEHYYQKGDAIYFIPGGNAFERGSKQMDADPATFEVIGKLYARDKDKIYFQGCPQQLVDRATFRLQGTKEAPADVHNAYYFTGIISVTRDCANKQLKVVAKADSFNEIE